MDKVIVTPRSLSGGRASLVGEDPWGRLPAHFSQAGSPTDRGRGFSRRSPTRWAISRGVERIGAKLIDAASRLRVISRNGTGVDNIDLEAAGRCGIVIRRAEGANARGVAELAFGHILATARNIAGCDADLKAGSWVRAKGFELEGKTLGLLGCGKIGKLVRPASRSPST